jgi:hypothetical protein
MVDALRSFAASMVAFGLVCTACGTKSAASKGVDAGSSDGGPSAQDYATAVCKLLTRCCATLHRSNNFPRCRSALDLSVYDAAVVSNLKFSPENARACLAQLSSVPDLCADPDAVTLTIPACTRVYLGAKAEHVSDAGPAMVRPGRACLSSADCAPASEGKVACVGSAGASICQVQSPGKPGDGPCSSTVDRFGHTVETQVAGRDAGLPAVQTVACEHDRGAACDFATQKCVALADIGQPCVDDLDCVDAAYCDCVSGSPCTLTTKLCVARSSTGASCTLPGPYHQCPTDDYCDDATNTCKAQMEVGQPCTKSPQCRSRLCAANICATQGQPWLDIACNAG